MIVRAPLFSDQSGSRTRLTAYLYRLLAVHPGPAVSADAAASPAGAGTVRIRLLLAELVLNHLVREHRPGRDP
ncbi:hypothetical protein AB0368_23430 [Actinoplanes sp. NPDC051475]|uniref:hypothetical protein n=1 Tax=Actinoplanes sp. NPDC051475 TaxID=3157225 RepID=UPI00344C9412